MRLSFLILPFFSMMAFSGCQPESGKTAGNGEQSISTAAETPLFRLVPPEESNIHFANPLQENAQMNIFLYDNYYSGGGVAIGDVNGDSLPDLYFTANLIPNRLFLNEGNLKFREATKEAGILGSPGWTTGCTMADVNNDGHLDLYVCKSGKFPEDQRRNQLFINRGDGTFAELAKSWGLDDPGYSMQAVFFDYDGDGDLDCYLLNYPIEAFKNFYVEELRAKRDPLAGDKLYRNDGDHFTDVSAKAGISGSPIGFSLSASVSDFNQDGWLDLYISNDFTEHDFYYLNNGNGTFRESLTDYIGHTSQFAMGNDAQDINRDGWQDLVVLDMMPETNFRQKTLLGPNGYDRYMLQVEFGFHRQQMRNTLQLNNGFGLFSEVGQLAGISNTDWSWSALLADYDNDGWNDLYVTNGFKRDYTNLDFLKYDAPSVQQQAQAQGQEADLGEMVKQLPSVSISNFAYKNKQNGGFEKVTSAWGMNYPSFSNGAAYADLDRDGDLDIVVNNIDSKAFLFENKGRDGRHWLQIQLQGKDKNRFGVGALVRVETADGIQEQYMMPNRGFLSCMEPVLHFGLGEEASVKRVSIRWPDGKVQLLEGITPDRRITLHYDKATNSPWVWRREKPLFQPVPNRLTVQHQENEGIDFKLEPLLPHFCSSQGPVMAGTDSDGDGAPDLLFIGGSKGFKGHLLKVQSSEDRDPTLTELSAGFLTEAQATEDGGAAWLDVNRDGHPDLYVCSGSYECTEGPALLTDRLYLSDGRGGYALSPQDLSFTSSSAGASPAVADYDQDGYPDLFVGGRVLPGKYGLPAASYLLHNQAGTLRPVALPGEPSGLVTSAQWADLDGNGWTDLVVAGEWMPITIYYNQNGTLQAPVVLPGTSGWWYSLNLTDLDGDGDVDITAGNRGLNAQMQASVDKPTRMYVKDFDGNGVTEPIITYFIGDKAYPAATRDDMLDQLNMLKKRYTRYAPYGEATYETLLTPEERAGALEYSVQTFSTTVFRNDGKGGFSAEVLPAAAQISPIWGIAPRDLNGDGLVDLVLTGNFYDNRAEAGPYDGNRGAVLIQSSAGTWTAMSPAESGLFLTGDTRSCLWIGHTLFIVNNRGPLQLYRYAKPVQ